MSGWLVFEDLLRPRKILPRGVSATHEHMEPSLVFNTLVLISLVSDKAPRSDLSPEPRALSRVSAEATEAKAGGPVSSPQHQGGI